MATTYPASFSLSSNSSSNSLQSLLPNRHRGTAASLPVLPQFSPPEEMEELEQDLDQQQQRRRRRRDHRSLTPTRPTRPPSTRTSSGDDESCTFLLERSLANPRRPNETAEPDTTDNDDDTNNEDDGRNRLSEIYEEEELEENEQYRRHSKDDEKLFRSGRRRSI